jgi:putative transposase
VIYALYPATFYYWKKKFVDQGTYGLDNSSLKEKLKMVKELEKQIRMLIELLAQQKLENAMKNELLKKSVHS